jgi:hypothetical protein
MKIVILALAASTAALAQDTQHVYHFTNLSTPASFQEVTNVFRTLADLNKIVSDPASKTITTSGGAAQIAIADWLAPRLDGTYGTVSQLYQVPGTADDVVQVINASAAQTPAALQELVNVVRTAADINRVFPFNATKSIVVRAASERVKLASWLVSQLLSPPASMPAEFLLMNDLPRFPQKRIHLYVLQKATSPTAIQETVNIVRTMADVNRVFPFNQTNAVVARGNDEQIAICDWLIPALDKTPPGAGVASEHIQILSPYPTEAEERVFYLPLTSTQTDVLQLINRIRTDTGMNRVFPSFTAMAISLRGNAAQVAKAEEIVRSH